MMWFPEKSRDFLKNGTVPRTTLEDIQCIRKPWQQCEGDKCYEGNSVIYRADCIPLKQPHNPGSFQWTPRHILL
ncbi:hypothetical protein J0S82_016850 [Galemys pyrenaicus]|uniref:Uncharacterized protein n=1 Tax=Galemys pyrenaicus TaxID=202257 RepID=A0A8J6AHI6_GALPY|nr:hypothetical protein J0S82_016850 [Galemys pyrenaicus]